MSCRWGNAGALALGDALLRAQMCQLLAAGVEPLRGHHGVACV
jgi:hypothetical protein